jgi:3-hydroxybutyryl-CoA dehydrogenase
MAATPPGDAIARPSRVAGRAAIIGGGMMGHGIAQVLACAGMDVVVHDAVPGVLASVRERIASNLRALGADPSPAEGVELEPDLERSVEAAEWVFEAAPEKLELKQALFERLDRAAPPDAVLATNTSVIRIGEIAERAVRRGRIVGTHWWSPPYLVPLVEVIQGDETTDETVARTIALLQRLGKTPVHVRRDVAGFVGNRLQHALWREAFSLIEEGVCDAETVDTVVKEGFGRRLGVLGPIENADMVGLDLTLDIHRYVLPRLNPPSEPSPGLRERVERGDLGMATGRGFRTWTPEEADAVRDRVRRRLVQAAGE